MERDVAPRVARQRGTLLSHPPRLRRGFHTNAAETVKGLYRRGKIFWLGHQRNHRRVFISLETDDEAIAIQRARHFLAHPDLNPSAGLHGDIAAFLQHQTTTGLYSAASADSKGAILRKFARWSGVDSSKDVSSHMVTEFYEAQRSAGLQEVSAQTYVFCRRAFFGWCVDQRIIRENPVIGVKLGRVTPKARTLFCTREERDCIIAAAPDDSLRFVFYCGFHAGLRKNEIIQCRPDWFNLGLGTLTVPVRTETFRSKNSKSRTIPLTSEFQQFLKEYGLQSPFMLRPDVKQGHSLFRYDYDRPFHACVNAVGLPWVTSHVMRHTFASLLASASRSIYKVALWLGDTVETTQRHYAKLLPVDHDIELD